MTKISRPKSLKLMTTCLLFNQDWSHRFNIFLEALMLTFCCARILSKQTEDEDLTKHLTGSRDRSNKVFLPI